MSNHAFVYGTLLFPEIAQRVANISVEGEPATLLGYRRFEAKTRERGNYPAIVKDESASVDGLVYRDLSDQQIKALDEFEDIARELYVKQTVRVVLGSEELEVGIYVAGNGLIKKLEQPLQKAWSPVLFQRNELDWYIEKLDS